MESEAKNLLNRCFDFVLLHIYFEVIILCLEIEILNGKREEALKAALFGEANNFLFIHLVDGGFWGFIKEIPISIYSAFFRPMIWEANNSILIILSAFENVILLILVVYSLVKKWKLKELSEFFYPILIYCLSLAFIIGYTTPVTGGLVRYKTAFLLPLLLILLNKLEVPNSLKKSSVFLALNRWILK
jgi:hypothetical protein